MDDEQQGEQVESGGEQQPAPESAYIAPGSDEEWVAQQAYSVLERFPELADPAVAAAASETARRLGAHVGDESLGGEIAMVEMGHVRNLHDQQQAAQQAPQEPEGDYFDRVLAGAHKRVLPFGG